MQETIKMVEKVITEHKASDKIKGVGIYPINQDGRQVTCFSDMHVNNAELYDYNVLKKGGNHLLINCWFSPFHCHPKWHLRKITPANNAVYDCTTCDFCLFDAAGYNMFFSLSEDVKRPSITIESIVDKVEENLNAPVCNVTYKIGDKEKTINRKEPVFERREKPCYKPMNTAGIMQQSQSRKAIAERMKKRYSTTE